VVFQSNRGGNWEVYKMTAGGSNQQNLTQSQADDTSPAWSPDGGWVVFASNRDGNWEVYKMRADGSNQQNLTQNPATDASPAWWPYCDLFFQSNRDGNWEVYTMAADGSSQQNLTQNPSVDMIDSWAAPSPTPTATPTSTATPTATPTTVATPTSTPTATPTGTSIPTATPTSTITPTAPPCADAYEPDDEWFQARSIIADEPAQAHNFHRAGDVDFVKFAALNGGTYTMRTFNLGGRPANDTTLTLYDVDGTTQLAYNDEHPLEEPGASRIVWKATDTGTYFLKAAQFNPDVGGCELTYLLEVTHAADTPTPTASPTVPPYQVFLPIIMKNWP
jgi:hypothetical protein